MSLLFPNQNWFRSTYKHVELPVYITDEFSFFRCLAFSKSFYGKTASELHLGNLREGKAYNRYSQLFPDEKVSYWADSPKTARAEVKYHNKTNNLITFWGYDDASSSFPTREDNEPLIIIDGRNSGFSLLLDHFEQGVPLTDDEMQLLERIKNEKPDCLAYESLRRVGGVNYLFFEKGFNKLSLREVNLRLGDFPGRNTAKIVCAYGSDYIPVPESYGCYFSSIAKCEMNQDYLGTEEYKLRSTR